MNLSEVDVLVVGAGPSGLAAAIQLRSLGIRDVCVVDRERAAGGVPRHCQHTGFGFRDLRRMLSGPGYARRYVETAEKSGVQIYTGVTVTDWLGENQVGTTSSRGIGVIRAGAIVLATGCRERPRAARLVPGSRPEGVFTTGSLQRFVYEFGHRVGERAVVVGAEHVSYSAVHTLRHAGLSVAGMVTEHPRHQSFAAYIRIAKGLSRVPLYTNSRVTNILGKDRVAELEITNVATGAFRKIACDTVVFSGDWIPDREVARRAGLALDSGTLGPAVDGRLRSSHPGVFAVGNLVHPGETADTAALSGRAAARHVAEFLANGGWPEGQRIAFEYDPEMIQWVSPNVLNPGQTVPPQGRFIFRAARVLGKPVLSVRQGERLLWRQKFRRLVPNLPYHLPADFIRRIDPEQGPVHLSLQGG